MKKILLSLFTGFSALVFGQNYVNQVIIVNEGYYDYMSSQIVEPVTVAVYDPATQVYQVVNTLVSERFASDAIVVGNEYYVAADQTIYKFDLDSHQELASVSCPGVRNIAHTDGKIIATRGEYMIAFTSYLHVYNAADLTLVQEFTTANGPQFPSQNLVVDGTNVYFAVNNGFDWGNEVGLIGKLDLSTMTYGNEIDLGVDGKNPDNMMIKDGFIYTVNNKDWSGASISKVSFDGSTNSTINLASASTGCGTSSLRDDKIIYQISMESVLNEFNVAGMNVVGPVAGFDLNYYELAQDPVSGNLYTSVTDFFSYGTIYVYDASNNVVTNFAAGVSPGTIVFDVRSSAGIEAFTNEVSVYPNPFEDRLMINGVNGVYYVTTIAGSIVANGNLSGEDQIDLSLLNAGQYLLNIQVEDGRVITKKINKN